MEAVMPTFHRLLGLNISAPCVCLHLSFTLTQTKVGANDMEVEMLSLSNEWAFPKNQVVVEEGEEGVLGRGSYGEVRVAKWRGIRVAAKQLHALCGGQDATLTPHEMSEVQKELLKEMQLLSRLRHPNLLLFLGVTFDPRTKNPLSIITELMPSSLYDLLEVRRIRLGQTEVLDLAGDISHGLSYLHGHSPSIVHRDISSKNILYDGRTAKLADLGQAKAIGRGGGSRQTAMPGAMIQKYAVLPMLMGKALNPLRHINISTCTTTWLESLHPLHLLSVLGIQKNKPRGMPYCACQCTKDLNRLCRNYLNVPDPISSEALRASVSA